MENPLQIETLRLEQFKKSTLLGICYLDPQGRLMQVFDEDDSLRKLLVGYQQDRVDQLLRAEESAAIPGVSFVYPVQED